MAIYLILVFVRDEVTRLCFNLTPEKLRLALSAARGIQSQTIAALDEAGEVSWRWQHPLPVPSPGGRLG